LFEQLLLTRAVAVIVGQPESFHLPSRESVHSLLTDDEIETAIQNRRLLRWRICPARQRRWSYAVRGKWL
jgi:hypothetical protein